MCIRDRTPAPSAFIAAGSLPELLDHVFDSLTSISSIKGMNAAMLLPDGSLWKRASGLAEQIPTQIDLTTDHLMGMGSISKSFVSATLLLMSEDGLLSLDDSIGVYLDPYPNVPGYTCLLYTSDAADERSSVDLGGRRIIKKKNTHDTNHIHDYIK